MHIELNKKSRERLLSKLCIELGFCLPPEPHDKLLDDPPTDLAEFVDAVFVGEGLDPETADLHLKRQVRDMIVEAYHHEDAEYE